MTPKEFVNKLKRDKTVNYFEFEFSTGKDKKIIVTNFKKMVCDGEKYNSPEEAYHVYRNVIQFAKKDNPNPKKIVFGKANWRNKERNDRLFVKG